MSRALVLSNSNTRHIGGEEVDRRVFNLDHFGDLELTRPLVSLELYSTELLPRPSSAGALASPFVERTSYFALLGTLSERSQGETGWPAD